MTARISLSIPLISPQEAAERATQRELRFLLAEARKWMKIRSPEALCARIEKVLSE